MTTLRAGTAFRLLPVILLLWTGWACSDTPHEVVRVATVAVEPDAASLAPGESRQLAARLRDSRGNTLTGRPVAWTTDASGAVSVDQTGRIVGLAAGNAVVTATSEGVQGTAQVTVTVPPVATRLSIIAQPAAAAASGVAFAQQPAVRLLDAVGAPFAQAGVVVTAAIASGGGTLGGALTATTDAAGTASFTNLSITGLVGQRTLLFTSGSLIAATSSTITITAGAAATLAANGGDGQSAPVGSTVPVAPSVIATDASGNPVAGVNVTFAVTAGGGSLAAGATVATGAAGIATAPAWTLGSTAGTNTLTATAAGLAGSPVSFTATGTAITYPNVRVVTFGDSNTDYGYGVAPTIAARSYVSNRITGRLAASDPNHANQLAGLIESAWGTLGFGTLTAVNHGVSATSTGGGGFGGADRHPTSAPNARAVVNGITRYEAEVLGRGYPWNGGEYHEVEFPDGGIVRVRSFTPGPNDFAYVSMGTNDPTSDVSTAQTITNLTWMADQWLGQGLAADRFIITTLAPRTGGPGATYPQINDAIRAMAAARGIRLIDLAAYTSNDNGLTWKSESLHVGDGLHYTTAVRAWIADQIVAHISSVVQPHSLVAFD